MYIPVYNESVGIILQRNFPSGRGGKIEQLTHTIEVCDNRGTYRLCHDIDTEKKVKGVCLGDEQGEL